MPSLVCSKYLGLSCGLADCRFDELTIMKSPNFENCQIAMDQDGFIIKASDSFGSWVGKKTQDLIGQGFLSFLISLEASWKILLPNKLYSKDFEQFLPLSKNDQDSSIGVFLSCCNYSQISVVSLSPPLLLMTR